MWVLTHRSAHFSGDCIFALRGLPPEIFTRARYWPRLPSTHPNWDGGPTPKFFNRENLKFGLKFSVYTSISSDLMGISSQFLSRRRAASQGLYTSKTWVHFLEGLPRKIREGKKPSKIFRDFRQLSTLIANISGTDPQIENLKSSWSTTTPSTLGEKSWWTLVHKRKSYWTWILTHRSTHFSGDCISALRGCCALKFLPAL